ncbi:MAG: SH3 domain-containing protein [Clostridiales bacterium]|nr:SH3 domain-containing protein [Clostridiales bacterium]
MSLKRILSILLIIILAMADIAVAENYFAKTSGSVPVYASPSKSSKKLGTLSGGTWVYLDATKNGWAKIELNGKVGYAEASHIKKASRTMYVKTDKATIYKSASSSSTRMEIVGYGTKLSAAYISGSYIYVNTGNNYGFVAASSVQLSDPNTLKKTVYIQQPSGKIYSLPDTSSSSWTVSGSTKLTCTALYKDTWARVTAGGKTGYVKKSQLGTKAYSVPKTTVYVTSGSAVVHSEPNSSSAKIATIAYGTKLTAAETSGSYTKISSGSHTGWIKTGDISTKNPNTLNTTVYINAVDVKIYTLPSTTSSYGTVPTSAALKCTALYDGTWFRVTYKSKVGFVKKDKVSTKKLGSSTSSPASVKSVSADWYKSNIQSIFARGDIATVTDVATSISWRVKRKGGNNHADVEPLTAADTAAMKKACGGDFLTWHRRSVWVSIDGKKYAASMNCKNHGKYNIKDNGFDGHFCIHFTNSRTHCSNKVDADHQNHIKMALAKG